ncbi:ATP-binding cassette domain-containing protein [Paenibacillus rhizoplanae]
MTKAEAYALGLAALEKLNLSRCEQLMNSYPHTLSGGMLQRIIIALSLILEPEIIIADEATTALDVRNQGIVLDELDSIKQSGIGLILVTHDFGVAARLADEVIVMKEGLIIETGTIHEVFTSPRDTYTQELLQASLLKKGGETVITIRNLHKQYTVKDKSRKRIVVDAVNHISLTLQDDTGYALIGESGSGKSTLAKKCLRE